MLCSSPSICKWCWKWLHQGATMCSWTVGIGLVMTEASDWKFIYHRKVPLCYCVSGIDIWLWPVHRHNSEAWCSLCPGPQHLEWEDIHLLVVLVYLSVCALWPCPALQHCYSGATIHSRDNTEETLQVWYPCWSINCCRQDTGENTDITLWTQCMITSTLYCIIKWPAVSMRQVHP